MEDKHDEMIRQTKHVNNVQLMKSLPNCSFS